MTQYDAGPGDWSDREWEEPDRKREPHATRRRLVLPPWALLAILVGVVIILCVALVLFVRALRSNGDEEEPAAVATSTSEPLPTDTPSLLTAILLPAPEATEPPGESPAAPTLTEIAPGAVVIVQGTRGAGLNIRAEPSSKARIVTSAKEGAEVTVLEGPEQAGGYTWWKVSAPDGKEGWGAGEYLVLKSE
ncbi:SH3 domain-containing protein [Chloroflexota bacterium]